MSELPYPLPHRTDPALVAYIREGHFHPGLLFHRWLPCWRDDRGGLFEAGTPGAPEVDASVLHRYVERWKVDPRVLKRVHARQEQLAGVSARFRCRSRLVFGLGADHPLDNGFTFEHVSGAPVLPGSSLKGLARAYGALAGVRETVLDELFGRAPNPDTDDGGACGRVVFLDAWPEHEGLKLEVDILNPHEVGYYRAVHDDKADPPDPLGTDSPIPVNFLAVAPKAVYRVRVIGAGITRRRDPDAPEQAERGELLERDLRDALLLLQYGLEDLGVGAKTAAGYGRMERLDAGGRAGAAAAPEPPPRPVAGSSAGAAPAVSAVAPTAPAVALRPFRFVWINATREPDRKGLRRAATAYTHGPELKQEGLAPAPLYNLDDVGSGRVDWGKVRAAVEALARRIDPGAWTEDAPLILIGGLASLPVWGLLGARLTRFAASSVRFVHAMPAGQSAIVLDPSDARDVAWLDGPAGLPDDRRLDTRPVVLSVAPGEAPPSSLFDSVAPDGVAGIVHYRSHGELRPQHAGATLRTLVDAVRLARKGFPESQALLLCVNGPAPVALFAGMAVTAGLWPRVELLSFAAGRYLRGLTL